jgi:DNA-damage-inducible protein J
MNRGFGNDNDGVLTVTEYIHIIIIYIEDIIKWRCIHMATTTNLNIRTDKDVKEQAEQIFSELGLSMTTAVNIFLRTTIRERGIPFTLKLDVPNDTTAAAIEEGRRIALDSGVKGYTSIEELKAALDL